MDLHIKPYSSHTGKIEKINKEEAQAKKEKQAVKSRRTSTSRRSTRMNPVVKVLTSATFIRGVLGVLKKAMK